MTAPRMTLHVRLVLEHMLTDPSAQHYSYEIARQTLLDPPTVSTILVRLVKAGWLTEELEAGDARALGRGPRHYVRLTELGIQAVRADPEGKARHTTTLRLLGLDDPSQGRNAVDGPNTKSDAVTILEELVAEEDADECGHLGSGSTTG
jgi:DNA-binding MarR family transcriptional regulator